MGLSEEVNVSREPITKESGLQAPEGLCLTGRIVDRELPVKK